MIYQQALLEFGEKILTCSKYAPGGSCRSELAYVSESVYKHGPEIAYVGRKYGKNGYPKVLFSRLNPTWNADIGWFGTLESINEYRLANSGEGISELFDCYLKGWTQADKTYRGLRDAGTVTGYANNTRRLSPEEKRKSPLYGIQLILEQMVRLGVFPSNASSALEFCAINNVVKCAGALEKWNPSSLMYKNCNYYIEELDLLVPDVLVVFGNDADKYLRSKLNNRFPMAGIRSEILLSSGSYCRYFKFPHPLGQGKTTWLGHDIQHLCVDTKEFPIPGQKELEQFAAGPGRKSTELLYRYTVLLARETKNLKRAMFDSEDDETKNRP
jgi:hypothetical protein